MYYHNCNFQGGYFQDVRGRICIYCSAQKRHDFWAQMYPKCFSGGPLSARRDGNGKGGVVEGEKGKGK